jgi:hypothetical protein
MKQKLLKAFTLTLFFSLLAGFVCFRSGLFENSFLFSPNSSPLNTAEKDSVRADTNRKFTLFPSSKSILLPDNIMIETRQTLYKQILS